MPAARSAVTAVPLDGLRIIAINVNSIVGIHRRAELLDFAARQQPDIVLISETHLNPRHSITFKDFEFVRNDRRNCDGGGGTGILVGRHYRFRHINRPEFETFECIEVSCILFSLPRGGNLYILSVYAVGNNRAKFKEEFHSLFTILELNRLHNYYIIAGDLNAKHTSWLNATNNPRGVFLKSWIEQYQIEYKCELYGSESPTWPRANSYLDLCIADARLNFNFRNPQRKLQTLPYDSDHNAILIEVLFDGRRVRLLPMDSGVHRLNFKQTNWKKFQERFIRGYREECPPLDGENDSTIAPGDRNLSNEEILQYLLKLENLTLETIEQVVPKIKPRNNMEGYETAAIKRLKKVKSLLLTRVNKIYRRYGDYHHPILVEFKSLLKIARDLIRQHYVNEVNFQWREKLKGISPSDPDSMFTKINTLFRKKSRITVPRIKVGGSEIQHLIDSGIDTNSVTADAQGNYIVMDDALKLELIGEHFESVHRPRTDLEPTRLSEIVERDVHNFKYSLNGTTVLQFSSALQADLIPSDNLLDYFVSCVELTSIFRRVNNKRSSGMDGIPNVVLRHLPDIAIRNYCILFNNLLNNSFFPGQWKKARVFPILKRGKDSSSPQSYRPISLLPNISKVFEVLVLKALNGHIKKKELLPNAQFGFRSGHSTIHAITKVTSDICWRINNGECVGACLIDMEKAFDTVWLDGLIFRLLKNEFPSHLVAMMCSMLYGKCFVITDGNLTTSREFHVLNGLQQGTVTAPTLFAVFAGELLNSFDFNKSPKRSLVAFADDLIAYTAHKKVTEVQVELQKMFNDIKFFTNSWRMKINAQKCETILFRNSLAYASRNLKRNWRDFHIVANEDSSERIPHKKCVRYLGVRLDERLQFNEHVKVALESARKAFMSLRRLFYAPHLSRKVKIICYLTLVRPVLTYGCAIWFNLSASQMEKIRIFERKCLRACTGLNRTASSNYEHYVTNEVMYAAAAVPRIDTVIVRLIRNHIVRSASHGENPWVSQPFYPNDGYFEKTLTTGFIPPEAFVYLDRNGLILDSAGDPVMYHIHRRATDKRIEYPPNLTVGAPGFDWRYSRARAIDIKRDEKEKSWYWWLRDAG